MAARLSLAQRRGRKGQAAMLDCRPKPAGPLVTHERNLGCCSAQPGSGQAAIPYRETKPAGQQSTQFRTIDARTDHRRFSAKGLLSLLVVDPATRTLGIIANPTHSNTIF